MTATSPIHGDCWFLTGATASGKSALGLELAERLGAEILSLDSMAVYQGMDIGTAKPTAEERGRVAHHLLDLVPPQEDYSLAQYIAAAHAAVEEIRARGRVPLFVGGTPLYLKALLRGIFPGPPADHDLRAELQAIAQSAEGDLLHARLASVDPLSAARLHPRDTRRIIRALEVWEKTGQSITDLQQQFDRARPAEACRVLLLDWPRPVLAERIAQRVNAMLEAGLVAEVRGLLQQGPLSLTASQAVGYREVIDFLSGTGDATSLRDLIVQHTRQFAKRQATWFRSLIECRRIDMTGSRETQYAAFWREVEKFSAAKTI